MTLHPTAIRAYPTGLERRMLFTVDGAPAVLTRHETLALTDPGHRPRIGFTEPDIR